LTTDNIKRVMDAFYLGKRIIDMLPPLPDGITALYIRYLDVIGRLERERGEVKVSDIGRELGVQRPGVTRALKEMEDKNLVVKTPSEDDGRVTFITITPSGRELSKKYNEEVFLSITSALPCVDDKDVETLIETTEKIYSSMKNGRRQK